MSAVTWTTTWHKRKGLDPDKLLPHTAYYGSGMDSISDYAARTTADRWGGQTSWTRAERPSNKAHQKSVAKQWKRHQERMDREIMAVQNERWIHLNIMQAELNEQARHNQSLKQKSIMSQRSPAPSTASQKKPKKKKKKKKKTTRSKTDKAEEIETEQEGFLPSIGGPKQQQQQQQRRRRRRPPARRASDDEDDEDDEDEESIVERDKRQAKEAILLGMIPQHLHRDFTEDDLGMLEHILRIPSPRQENLAAAEAAASPTFDVTTEIHYVKNP